MSEWTGDTPTESGLYMFHGWWSEETRRRYRPVTEIMTIDFESVNGKGNPWIESMGSEESNYSDLTNTYGYWYKYDDMPSPPDLSGETLNAPTNQ